MNLKYIYCTYVTIAKEEVVYLEDDREIQIELENSH